MSKALDRLLRPRSIAVFGGRAAAEVIRQSAKIGFAGEIWPVHPYAATIAGKAAFRSLGHLPGAPDAAFIGINRHDGIDIMADLAAAGCGGAVAYASGYAEAGPEGAALQKTLAAAASDMPFLGPNCYGFINYLDRALVWPDQFGGTPVARGVAIIAQSGNIGLNLTMQRRALPIGMVITLGNQASIGHAEAMHAVLDDPRITAIGLHMEGLGDPNAFADAVARAHAQNVPIVALKTGRSAQGARIALSHTASLGSSDAVVEAYFRRIGIARVETLPALLEALKLLHVHGSLPGRSIASLSCSGGEAALMADMAAAAGVTLAPLTSHAKAAIAATLPDMASVSNPLDYHTFAWRNREALSAIFAAMLRAGADLTMLVLDFPDAPDCDPADWEIAADALTDAARVTGRRAAVLATLPECMPEALAIRLAGAGIAPLFGMAEALAAVAAAADCQATPSALPPRPAVRPGESHTRTFSEAEAKAKLATYGVPVPEGCLARSVPDAVEAARTIGFPVAMKAAGDIAHKTEAHGVHLHLADAASVRSSAETLLPLTGQLLVERMVEGGVAELIVGVARDAVLGLYLVIGAGGILAELLADTATLLLPAGRADIATALASLRIAKLLQGFRNAAPADIDSALDTILAIQDFAMSHQHALLELDVNPLILRGIGQGAVAADALIRLAGEPDA